MLKEPDVIRARTVCIAAGMLDGDSINVAPVDLHIDAGPLRPLRQADRHVATAAGHVEYS